MSSWVWPIEPLKESRSSLSTSFLRSAYVCTGECGRSQVQLAGVETTNTSMSTQLWQKMIQPTQTKKAQSSTIFLTHQVLSIINRSWGIRRYSTALLWFASRVLGFSTFSQFILVRDYHRHLAHLENVQSYRLSPLSALEREGCNKSRQCIVGVGGALLFYLYICLENGPTHPLKLDFGSCTNIFSLTKREKYSYIPCLYFSWPTEPIDRYRVEGGVISGVLNTMPGNRRQSWAFNAV